MELTVTGRKRDVSERFRSHLEDKLDKIPQLAPRVRRTEVVMTHEANPRQAKESERCEITCHVNRQVVRAEAAADDQDDDNQDYDDQFSFLSCFKSRR